VVTLTNLLIDHVIESMNDVSAIQVVYHEIEIVTIMIIDSLSQYPDSSGIIPYAAMSQTETVCGSMTNTVILHLLSYETVVVYLVYETDACIPTVSSRHYHFQLRRV
jgi:hypothetical protein